MSEITWLSPHSVDFPATSDAASNPNGLLAAGGDLSIERLVSAYKKGIFPWYEEPQPILWWSPNPRTVLFPEQLRISRSLNKRIKRGEYTVTFDQAFGTVMQHCANVPRQGQHGTWIGDEMLDAYCQLHDQGFAHSVESWYEDRLVGGLYGIAIGRIFFGESMFSLRSDASKVAFSRLVMQLKQWDYAVIDCQVGNSHLTSLGAQEIDRAHFEQLLRDNIEQPQQAQWSALGSEQTALTVAASLLPHR